MTEYTEATEPQGEHHLKTRYDQLAQDRSVYLRRAEQCARLTIPSMLPPEGHTSATLLPTPWQSFGARGVNHLASKLVLALLPPNSPFFKFGIDEILLEKLNQQEGFKSLLEEALAKMERSIMGEIEAKAIRTAVFEAIKHLLVSGNALMYVNPKAGVRIYRLDRFVCKRDPMGGVLEIVTKEDISPMELSEAGMAALHASGTTTTNDYQDTVELYTCIRRVGTTHPTFVQYQEINGQKIEGSDATYPYDKTPWILLRWTEIDNEDYGRSFCDEYLGDLKSLEALQKAIVQGSAAAAKVLFLVKPNGTTKKKVLSESESGDVREGFAEDVTVLQMNKHADFKVALETRNEIKQSISFAFLLNSAIQRNGERVTAEEIRYMAEELESSLGGVYSALNQSLQKPLVNIIMANKQARGELPQLPKGVVKVTITTGVEALGRGQDLSKLKAFVQDLIQFSTAAQSLSNYMNLNELIKRLGTGYSIDMKDLILTPEQTAQIQQQQQMQAMAHQLGPNAITQGGQMMKSAMEHQQQQQSGGNPNG